MRRILKCLPPILDKTPPEKGSVLHFIRAGLSPISIDAYWAKGYKLHLQLKPCQRGAAHASTQAGVPKISLRFFAATSRDHGLR